MKTSALATKLAVGFGLLATAGLSVQAAVVYNNLAPSSTDYTQRFNAGNTGGTSSLVGDEVTLGGPVTGGAGADHATLSLFQFDMWASGIASPVLNPAQIQAQVRFYANDGAPLGTQGTHLPGSTLWDSGLFPITIQNTSSTDVLPGDVTLYNIAFTTDVAGLVVPQDFTWAIQFSGLGANGMAGPLLWDPNSVGSSYPDYWFYNDTTSAWELRGAGSTIWNFASEFEGTAVPEPAPILAMACVILVGGMVAWRARSKTAVA